jgi:hypothetical protein
MTTRARLVMAPWEVRAEEEKPEPVGLAEEKEP